jgi:hypothetical protein
VKIRPGRYTADVDEGFVVYLIGMRLVERTPAAVEGGEGVGDLLRVGDVDRQAHGVGRSPRVEGRHGLVERRLARARTATRAPSAAASSAVARPIPFVPAGHGHDRGAKSQVHRSDVLSGMETVFSQV